MLSDDESADSNLSLPVASAWIESKAENEGLDKALAEKQQEQSKA